MPHLIKEIFNIESTLLLKFTDEKSMANLSATSSKINKTLKPLKPLIKSMAKFESNKNEIQEIGDELVYLDDNYFCAEFVDPKIQYEYYQLSKKRKALMTQQPLKKPRVKL